MPSCTILPCPISLISTNPPATSIMLCMGAWTLAHPTREAYFLGGEFPSIQGCSAMNLQGIDDRTLRIQGTAYKVDLKKEWGVDLVEKGDGYYGLNGMGSNANLISATPSKPALASVTTARIWLNECRAGLYIRSFSFPVPVNTEGSQARLSQGLLSIVVPKNGRFSV
jgi:hypothetical protein